MITLNEMMVAKYLEDIQEMLDATDNGDEVYSSLNEEKIMIEESYTNPNISFTDVLSKKKISFNAPTKTGAMKANRVSKIYFDAPDASQAMGLGLKQDKEGFWYLSCWDANISVLDIKSHLQSIGIPFKVGKFTVYNY